MTEDIRGILIMFGPIFFVSMLAGIKYMYVRSQKKKNYYANISLAISKYASTLRYDTNKYDFGDGILKTAREEFDNRINSLVKRLTKYDIDRIASEVDLSVRQIKLSQQGNDIQAQQLLNEHHNSRLQNISSVEQKEVEKKKQMNQQIFDEQQREFQQQHNDFMNHQPF